MYRVGELNHPHDGAEEFDNLQDAIKYVESLWAVSHDIIYAIWDTSSDELDTVHLYYEGSLWSN